MQRASLKCAAVVVLAVTSQLSSGQRAEPQRFGPILQQVFAVAQSAGLPLGIVLPPGSSLCQQAAGNATAATPAEAATAVRRLAAESGYEIVDVNGVMVLHPPAFQGHLRNAALHVFPARTTAMTGTMASFGANTSGALGVALEGSQGWAVSLLSRVDPETVTLSAMGPVTTEELASRVVQLGGKGVWTLSLNPDVPEGAIGSARLRISSYTEHDDPLGHLDCGEQKDPLRALSERRVGPIALGPVSYPEIPRLLGEKTGVVFGFESTGVYPGTTAVTLDFKGGELMSLLGAASRLYPGVRAQLTTDGARLIHDPENTDLFRLPVKFAGVEGASRKAVLALVRSQPELSDWKQRRGCVSLDLESYGIGIPPATSITIPPGAMTLEALVEKAAQQTGRHFWLIVTTRDGAGRCNLSISF